MEIEEYLERMLDRYKLWLDNKKPLTKEEAAFEYLKRNPYFIETVFYYENHLRSYSNYENDDKQLFEVMKIRDHMYTLLSKVFLYTGSDISDKYRVYEEDNTNDLNLANFLSFDRSNLKDGEYSYDYSRIYLPYPSMPSEHKYHGASNSVKKEYPVDSGQLLKDIEQKRWLSHLLPSLYLKINPFYSSDRLKSDLTKVLSIISNDDAVEYIEPKPTYSKLINEIRDSNELNSAAKTIIIEKLEASIDEEYAKTNVHWKRYYQYAIPEILINEDATEFKSFTAPTFGSESKIPIVSLIIYDLQKIFKLKAPELKKLLKERFTEYEFTTKYELHRYFASSGAKDGYSSTVYAKEFNKTRTREVVKRINGGYLDFIYPEESITEHFNLVKQEGLKDRKQRFKNVPEEELENAQEKFWQELKDYHKYGGHIADISAMGVVGVRDFSTKEYREWSKAAFDSLDNTKTNKYIFSILLL